jgi:DNA (cytosine-5)-methyltransferase 1
MSFNVVSTFSGTGGSSEGYKRAGFNVLASLEFIEEARKSYRLNFPNTPIIAKNIRETTGKEILELINLKKGELDVLDGSPPCASFSTQGAGVKYWGKEKKYSDTVQRTDDLFDEQIRLIDEIKPKAIVIENVKGMTMGIAKNLLSNYILKIKKIGYDINVEVLNSAYFETATRRERMFIIGFRNDLKIKPSHPKPFSKPITYGEAIKSLKIPDDELEFLKNKIKNHKPTYEYWKKCPAGYNLSKVHPKGSYFSVTKASYDKPLPTIDTTPTNLIHPTVFRILSISELKICSSFGLDFKLSGSYEQQYERIGRAVPPNLMKHIALHIKEKLKNSSLN